MRFLNYLYFQAPEWIHPPLTYKVGITVAPSARQKLVAVNSDEVERGTAMKRMAKVAAVLMLALVLCQSVAMAAPTQGAYKATTNSSNPGLFEQFFGLLGAIWGGHAAIWQTDGAIWGGH
jgi:hypothetical protein